MMEMMVNDGNDGKHTIFVTVGKISKETGIPRNQIYKDILSGELPAIKRGKSYYIFDTEASKYISRLVYESKGEKYDFLKTISPDEFNKLLVEVMTNDKSKNKS